MVSYGLKSNIVINLIILLMVAMALIDLVMVISTQRLLTQSMATKGEIFLMVIEKELAIESDAAVSSEKGFHHRIDGLMIKADIKHLVVVDPLHRLRHSIGDQRHHENTLLEYTERAMDSGEQQIHFFGETWGVFFKQREYLVISAPLYIRPHNLFGVSVVLSLTEIYMGLRQTQRIFWIYMVINTIALSVIGFFRFQKIMIKPMQKLLKRAEEYPKDDADFFIFDQSDSEFNQLSKALNRMIQRIQTDKERLQSTVRSLEKANADLQQAQKDIIRAEKLASVGRLSAGIAHEIGNPISIVMGYLDLLKRSDMTADEKKEFVDRIGNEINRIHSIIRQLLDFSRKSEGQITTVSVHETIQEITGILKYQPAASRVEMTFDLAAQSDEIKGEPEKLQQVFLNIILNAVDAILSAGIADGRISIETRNEKNGNGTISIRCSDNGPGISPNDISNIFDPFYTTKDPGKGTGLGLYVCFMIVEALGGKIEAASTEGQGTDIILHLPLYRHEYGQNKNDQRKP